ncbi:MAG: hypothetical protein HY543_10235 [Deltaproteobacteria bacterium]|nr:hypothetical protein [Deltaproteobacteria bacterium]
MRGIVVIVLLLFPSIVRADPSPTWTIPLALSCRGVREAAGLCSAIAARARSLPAIAAWLARPAVRRQGRDLRVRLARRLGAGATPSVTLRIDRGIALLAEGRVSEGMSDFLAAMAAAPTWQMPADGAMLGLALLWKELDDTQRRDHALAIATALADRLHAVAAPAEASLPLHALYRLAGDDGAAGR